MGDWYSVEVHDFDSHGGRNMLRRYYNDSPAEALMEIYPDHDWKPWNFKQAPKICWQSLSLQKSFLETIQKEISASYPSNFTWSAVTVDEVRRRGGGGLLDRYGGSLADLLTNALRISAEEIRDIKQSKNFWKREENLRKAMRVLEEQLAVRSPEDWYSISAATVKLNLGGGSLLKTHGSLRAVLQAAYPQHFWDQNRFRDSSSIS